MKRIGFWSSGLAVATCLAAAATVPSAESAAPGQARQGEDYNSGAYLYKAFCASCHGEHGRGDGPVADLTEPHASNLTLLQSRAGGVYPRAQVRAVLDGTTQLKGHDGPAMPNWSRVLRSTEGGDERVLQKRLDAIVTHVETLQVK